MRGNMPHKNIEEQRIYQKKYYQRLKSGEITARGTRSPKDILGLKFGHLTATKFSHRAGFLMRPYWEFTCECGNVKTLAAADVVSGKTTACGCLSQGKTKRYHDG